MSPSCVSIAPVDISNAVMENNETAMIQKAKISLTDHGFEVTSTKGGTDVQNSGWFEVKKKGRSNGKPSASRVAVGNRQLMEGQNKGQLLTSVDKVTKSEPSILTLECLCTSGQSTGLKHTKYEDRHNDSKEKVIMASSQCPVKSHKILSHSPDQLNSETTNMYGSKCGEDGIPLDRRRADFPDVMSLKKPVCVEVSEKVSGESAEDSRMLLDHHSGYKTTDIPKFKWGNFDVEDLRQNQSDISQSGLPNLECESVARETDTITCLKGGKQSSAELIDIKVEKTKGATSDSETYPDLSSGSVVTQENFIGKTLKSPYHEPEVCQDEDETINIVEGGESQALLCGNGNSSKIQSVKTMTSPSKFCGQKYISEERIGGVSILQSDGNSVQSLCAVAELNSEKNENDGFSAPVTTEGQESMEDICSVSDRHNDGHHSGKKDRSMDFSIAASMLADRFKECDPGESKERFRQRLWCYLFENLNRAIDELYFLCELECDMEQIHEALLVLKEAGLDFTELKSRVEGFEKVKQVPCTPAGDSLSTKVDHRRPHAIAWEVIHSYNVRRMTSSPHRAEILSSSLEAFRKFQQETIQKENIFQGKRRDSIRLLPVQQMCKEESVSMSLPSTELMPDVNGVPKSEGKQLSAVNSSDSSNLQPSHTDNKHAKILKVSRDDMLSPVTACADSAACPPLEKALDGKEVNCSDSSSALSSNSDSKVVGEVVQGSVLMKRTTRGSAVIPNQVDKCKAILECSETLTSIVDKEKEKKRPKSRTSLDAWKEKRNWEDILSSPLRSSARSSRSPITGRKSTEKVRGLHDRLMSPERKKKSPLETKKEVDEKQARATRIRRELENERSQRLQRTIEKLNRVSEWQSVKSTKLREGMHARQQRGESRHEAHLAQIARRASDESSKVSEVRFITSLNEENKKLSLQQKLQHSELRRAERLQVIKTKQKEDVAREEAALERRRLLEAERLQRIAGTQRRKEEAKARREEERRAASAAREAKAVEQVRKKEVRAKAQQEVAELLAQKLTEKLRESELRRKVYLEQIRERAVMEIREQASPSTRRPSSRDAQLKIVSGQINECDLPRVHTGLGVSSTKSDNVTSEYQVLKRRIKKIRQRLMAKKYEYVEPPLGVEGAGVGSITAAGVARSKIGRWLQELQRLQQARKAGTSSVCLILGDMVKYLEGKEAELHAARQAGLIDFVATALPASHTSKPEASQISISLLRVLKVLLTLPANRSYFIARNLLPPLIPILSTALENFSSLGSFNVIGGATSTCVTNGSLDKVSTDEKLEAMGEVLEGLLCCTTVIMGHTCMNERQLQMVGDLSELLVACEVTHRLCDLFALFDRPQMEGAPFPAPVLLGLNFLQTLTSPRGKLAGTAHDKQMSMRLHLLEPHQIYDGNVLTKQGAADSLSPIPENGEVEGGKHAGLAMPKQIIDDHPVAVHLETAQVPTCDVLLNASEDVQSTAKSAGNQKIDSETDQEASNASCYQPVGIPIVDASDDAKGGSDLMRHAVETTKVEDASEKACILENVPQDLKLVEIKGDTGNIQHGHSMGFLKAAIVDTGLVGLPSLLTAVLLQTNPRSTIEQAADVLPSNFKEVATGVLKVLNNLAHLDLAFVQNMLAMPDLQMEFFHLVSFLLSYCTCKWKSATDQVASLLLETLLLLGYFALLHPGNQAVLRWGKSPTILHKICDLPFAFFSDPQLTPILVGTLLAACYGSERNRDVVKQELSMDMFLGLLKASKDEIISQQLKIPQDSFQGDMSSVLSNEALPLNASMDESDMEMQQVQEKDEVSSLQVKIAKKDIGEILNLETDTFSGVTRRQSNARFATGKVQSIDGTASIKKINKSALKTATMASELEPSPKEAVGGKVIKNKGPITTTLSTENLTASMKRAKASLPSIPLVDNASKTISSNYNTPSVKRVPQMGSQDQLSSVACRLSSLDLLDSKDSWNSSFLSSAFMLQNRFPLNLLDSAGEFFSVGL